MLSIAHDIAKSGVGINARDTSVVSRNIVSAEDPNSTTKTLQRATRPGGGVVASGVMRAVDAALFERSLTLTASNGAQAARLEGAERLGATVGDPSEARSPAARLSQFKASLQLFAGEPQELGLATGVVQDAVQFAQTLRGAAETVLEARQDVDQKIANTVSSVNTLLADFAQLNSRIISDTFAGRDATVSMDDRDRLTREIAELVDIRQITRANNDVVLTTSGGLVLFEKVPRLVEFDPSGALSGYQAGNPIRVDGVPLMAQDAPSTPGGRLGGLLSVRDNDFPTYQRQLDELANGMIEAFAEADIATSGALPPMSGLFTYAGGPALPTLNEGLALTFQVSAAFEPDAGGDPRLLRDGGASGVSYVFNTTGAEGYSERLRQLLDGISTQRSFDATAKIGPSNSLEGFATASAAWVEAGRADATNDASAAATALQRTQDAWHNAVGVNLDDQLATLISLEQSYQASSRLLSVVDRLFDTLFAATG